ncbi:DUF342 domain-containing protein [Fervidobacterium gondwanense]|uniref:Flagellar Assembly Protein A N-terminal region domain-containing protein n=1 Tax=Fervidobacterium gondwanense DSM 13020 TaxID=1121883 RepID=A0A1M7SHQ6_FERGO|nr:FapA family protein [Fervidobacterium gondwanense]SHN58026.1 hypothetical protein SAMN02745226_00877 [Fervidobacterium gondwanense DSM 13020]
MDIIKAKEITEVFDEIEKRYGQTWYEIVAVEIQTDEHGEIKAVAKPLHGKFHPQTAHRDVERVKVKETVQDLLNVETLSALEDKVKEYENFKVNVTISDDEMKAFVTIIPGIINEMPTKDELAEALFNAGVVFGIKQDVLERIVNEKMTYQPILVAEGKEPQPPEDAKIDYKFKFLTGDLIEPGEEIPYCLSGQILAEKIPAIPGTPGHTVTGKELPARQGKDFDLRAFSGQNTKIEGDKIVATVSGQPYIDEQGRVCVKEVLVLSEKEISSQKSFDFPGSIMVNCGLDGNYRINSGKDVFIKGIVSGHVEINASGNVYINGGFFGRSKGKILAAGDVSAQFFSECVVISRRSVYSNDYIMNSEVIAGKAVVVRGKGTIIGGKVKAVELIEVREAGNVSEVSTVLEVGIDFDYEKNKTELTHRIRILIDEINELGILCHKLREIYKSVPAKEQEKVKSAIIRAELQRKELIAKLNTVRGEISKLKFVANQEALSKSPRIVIRESCIQELR